MHKRFIILYLCCLLLLPLSFASAGPVQLQSLRPIHRAWQLNEFQLLGVPAASNPYDPDVIAVDVSFTGPSGKTVTLPAFWYQSYTRQIDPGNSRESLKQEGMAGWRVRWTPLAPGKHRVAIVITEKGKRTQTTQTTVTVEPRPRNAHGFAHVEPTGKRYFQTSDGQPLPLVGENVCWYGSRGTYDYDDWFARLAENRMNYARLWMWHTSFGIEFFGKERLNYNQEHAWQLDYVMNLAAQKDIHIMLCLDYHGIFEEKPDMWGGNNYWPEHAYNKATGGPCANQNEFFTNPAAKALYHKRLRYLIGRYGAFPNLLAWEFFNEIDNEYRYIHPADVVAWHGEMSQWLKRTDPYKHMVTTSFGSAGEQKEMWQLPGMDYAQWHWYANWGGGYRHVAEMANGVAERFHREYGKPVFVSEFGSDGRGGDYMMQSDRQHRALHQGVWSGIFTGTAGTAMVWWWEYTHSENLYPHWRSLALFLEGTKFGGPGWKPLHVTAPKPGGELGERDPAGTPYAATIKLGGGWGDKPTGRLILRHATDAELAPLNGYIHGSSKPYLKAPFQIDTWAGDNAHLILHLNSVADNAALAVRVNGQELLRRDLPNKDGKFELTNEYNEDIVVPLPAGRDRIEVSNPGGDWAYLDWVKIENALPAQLSGPDGPELEAWAMGDRAAKTAIVWVLDPDFDWPRGADTLATTVKGGRITLHDLPDGDYIIEWWDTSTGKVHAATKASSRGGAMVLPVADFETDTAARILPRK